MRSYYTLCAHIRVPSLPLKKDRYKPERNGSPNVPLILQVRLALLRAFLKPPERRQHVADLVALLRAVDAGPDQLISFHRNISLNLFKRLIVSLIPPNVSHVHRMIRNKRLMQQLGIARLVTKHAAVRIQRFIPPGHTVILFPFRPFSMLIAGLHWRRLVRA
jgi:hypothetical protein